MVKNEFWIKMLLVNLLICIGNKWICVFIYGIAWTTHHTLRKFMLHKRLFLDFTSGLAFGIAATMVVEEFVGGPLVVTLPPLRGLVFRRTRTGILGTTCYAVVMVGTEFIVYAQGTTPAAFRVGGCCSSWGTCRWRTCRWTTSRWGKWIVTEGILGATFWGCRRWRFCRRHFMCWLRTGSGTSTVTSTGASRNGQGYFTVAIVTWLMLSTPGTFRSLSSLSITTEVCISYLKPFEDIKNYHAIWNEIKMKFTHSFSVLWRHMSPRQPPPSKQQALLKIWPF